MKAIVKVQLKSGVLDPQGRAITGALQSLGYDEVIEVNQGKIIELDLQGTDHILAKQRVNEMCEELLANTVIEQFSVDIID